MKGAQAVALCLKEQGVDTVFGYPGGMILPLYDAFYENPDIREILVTHEQNAAHAADGYARASGKVGVCIATSGPGATNLVTGLATAFMDSVPVVAITGQVDTSLLGRDAFQETDILDVTMPVTKPCFGVAYREEPLAEGDLKRELLLDMLGDLVVGGLTKLYRRLYDEALVNPEFSGDFIAVRGACTVAFTGESDTPRQVVDLLQEEIERMRREGVDPEVFMLVKNQMYGELLGDVEAVDDAAEEAAAACLKGRTLADEIAALAALTVEDANALLQTALREENRAYVQIDPAEK